MAGSGLQIQLWFDVYANKARGDSHEAVLFVVRGDEKPEELKQRADFCDSFPEVAHFGSDLIEFVDTADGIINDEEEFSMIGLLHDNSQDEPYFVRHVLNAPISPSPSEVSFNSSLADDDDDDDGNAQDDDMSIVPLAHSAGQMDNHGSSDPFPSPSGSEEDEEDEEDEGEEETMDNLEHEKEKERQRLQRIQLAWQQSLHDQWEDFFPSSQEEDEGEEEEDEEEDGV